MDMMERLRKLISELDWVKVEPDLITEQSVLANAFGLDSMELLFLAAVLEDEFQVKISERVLQGFVTVGDVCRYLKQCTRTE